MNIYSRFIAGTERHSLRDSTVSLSECRSMPAIKRLKKFIIYTVKYPLLA